MTEYKPARIVSDILKDLSSMVKPGIKTIEFDNRAKELIEKYEVTSYNKDYHPKWAKIPYPNYTCINVNGIIAHGVPGEYALKEGDIISLDLGVTVDGLCGDAGLTLPVGKISNADQRLLDFAKETTYRMIDLMVAGANTEDIARTTQRFVYDRGHYTINTKFAGHRIDNEMHMKPNIYAVLHDEYIYAKLEVGQIYCVEPMLTTSKDNTGVQFPNGWTLVTSDGKNSAFFEHMVRITSDGPEILTDHFQRG